MTGKSVVRWPDCQNSGIHIQSVLESSQWYCTSFDFGKLAKFSVSITSNPTALMGTDQL